MGKSKISVSIDGLDEFESKYKALYRGREVQAAVDKALYVGAGIIADEVRARLEGVLSGNSTGELEGSLAISGFEIGKMYASTRIGFRGYDTRTGVPNALKARVLESGRSDQPPRPFFRPAVNSVKNKAQDTMKQKFDDEIEKIIK